MYSGYAKAPVARMTSTSSMMRSAANRAATPSEYQVYGITTVASSISGGVTSNQTYPRLGAPRKAPGDPCPDVPEGACTHCVWVEDEDGNYVCAICRSELDLGCNHMHDYGYCWCPIDFDWKVIFFLAVLGGVYAASKQLKKSRA